MGSPENTFNMKEIFNIDFDRAAKGMTSSEVFGNELIVSDLRNRRDNKQRLENMPTIRLDAVSFFICTHGEVSFHVDYQDYKLHRNTLLQLSSIHRLNNVRLNSEFEGYMIAVSPKLAQHIMSDIYAIKRLSVKLERPSPLVELSETEANRLNFIIARIIEKMKEMDHSFQHYILKNEVSDFLLEIADINLKRSEETDLVYDKIGYKEDVVQRFISLVFECCKEEHEVLFYSKKMGMTTGNLSRILKEISGKSAVKWISDALVMESKILLQKPDINIQQAAEILNFADQSSFGKFFKKHTGLKPMEFKHKVQKA